MSHTLQQIRDAIKKDKRSAAAIARDAGVCKATMTKLTRNYASPTIATLEAVADALGLEIVVRKPRKGRK